jgi:hypothetical protein
MNNEILNKFNKEIRLINEELQKLRMLRAESYDKMNGDLTKISAEDYRVAKCNYEYSDKLIIEYTTRLDQSNIMREILFNDKDFMSSLIKEGEIEC